MPLSPELVVTYQNVQGGTIRGPEGQAKGFVLDLFRPMSMQGDLKDAEYFQHVYMGMGRPRKLVWMLLRNFPRDKDGALDWSIFENGPPDYLVKFEAELKQRDARTKQRLLRAQQELGMPPFEDLPAPAEDTENSVTRRVDLLENLLTAPQEQLYLQQWKDARKELATLAIDADLTSHT